MTKLAPEWVRTCDPVIRSPARYRWTTAPALAKSREIRVEVHASAVDGKSSRSVRSVTRSNRLSHVSSVSTARIKEEQRIAELKIKAAALDKKNALAHAKLKLQQDIDRLGLEEEMAIAGARSKVLDEYEERQTLASTVSHHSLRRGTKRVRYANI